MTPELAAALRRLKGERKVFDLNRRDPVFLCADGRPMNGSKLQKRWAKCKTAWKKVPDGLHFHDLRHTAASLMVNTGVDLFVVGNVLGHSSAQTTKRYAHLVLDRQREAVARLGASLGEAAG